MNISALFFLLTVGPTTTKDEYLDETKLVHSRHVFTSGIPNLPSRKGKKKNKYHDGMECFPSFPE